MPALAETHQDKGPDNPQRNRLVGFTTAGTQEELRDYLRAFCKRLYRTDVWADIAEGDIYYTSWRDLPSEGLLPSKYVQVSQLHPQADIYAPHTRYSQRKLMVIKRITKDNGSVEAAIRAFDHVLEGTRGKETQQVAAVRQRATELLDLFGGRSFSQITPEEFKAAQQKTYRLLIAQQFDPNKVYDVEKQRMSRWLVKGSLGKDSLARQNHLITICALQAAYRTAVERQRGLEEIAVTYARRREAVIFAREFSRMIFQEVADRLQPQALLARTLLKHLEKWAEPNQVGYDSGMIGTMVHQLERFIPVKPYKPVGKEAAFLLKQAQDLLIKGDRQGVIEQEIFPRVRALLLETLDKSRLIYPEEQTDSPNLFT